MVLGEDNGPDLLGVESHEILAIPDAADLAGRLRNIGSYLGMALWCCVGAGSEL